MIFIEWILLIFLIVCAIAVSISRSLLNSVIIFMSYTLVMAVIWILLQAPDLAITEAAVGAGVTSTLFYLALKRIGRQHEAAKGKSHDLNAEQGGEK
ncbi:MAG: DUF4040 domain-containing protein [Synergistaceae bacterium]|nr:DUF4040 domain-containing protein [Synergistaceae bacterium]MBQ4418710.1 DUF4040 domain-containing protein [Synergistaceae bacterium]MBQ7569572.1 DUF4040 domain-containing protein [Synergistaceae bacterium]MBQ9581006.1 DUF4040 domain-containing protein [Synergistaceae bacterium]MBQ9897002.1 DUF4040 domain-containing protein [Synergistaceae bacterium]